MVEKTFTHLTEGGVHMVEVGDKPVVKRSATARGKINLKESTLDLIKKEEIKKGNVLTTAQIAAIGAVKSTHHLIPLCHSLRITGVEVDFKVGSKSIEMNVSVKSVGKTGVEMEALTGVSVGLLTIWDMVKSVEKDENGQYPSTNISDIIVVKKKKN
ncbi:cyclic pyranopterin monophosphate synthase MoaC [Methanobacterium paludis]|uniref:Probable cyclic pyranopterin monophosphate synthase n=1 Tax=Methanobacterium paludis (strain DSM 25820 / JCM 18151 / SWAN1) TaxID=868131 RepID=F6D7G8_METPW|nr:molybdenum cofactor biosynthesis protein C [Methanobacterium paludis]